MITISSKLLVWLASFSIFFFAWGSLVVSGYEILIYIVLMSLNVYFYRFGKKFLPNFKYSSIFWKYTQKDPNKTPMYLFHYQVITVLWKKWVLKLTLYIPLRIPPRGDNVSENNLSGSLFIFSITWNTFFE